jgi:hypothetical protein
LYLPPTFAVEYRRPDKVMQNDYFDFSYSANYDSLNVWNSYSLLMVKARYIPVEKYPAYRSFVEELNSHGRENLILKQAGD